MMQPIYDKATPFPSPRATARVTALGKLQQRLKENLHRAEENYKHQYDKKHRNIVFDLLAKSKGQVIGSEPALVTSKQDVVEEEEDLYEVEKVIGRRKIRLPGRSRAEEQLKIVWTGFPEGEATWQPLETIKTNPKVIEFLENSNNSRMDSNNTSLNTNVLHTKRHRKPTAKLRFAETLRVSANNKFQ
ncbi:hypothetical protein M231_01048 [Tremella mesenterica]|uniref:Chromo domain-containing protein n=1 Tax=Tremella mesenterica TaxID=5217 RepID=A0A4Q1BTY7_TREME|nr:hypothetical protein M231_01048 [Tremella mesenterica]